MKITVNRFRRQHDNVMQQATAILHLADKLDTETSGSLARGIGARLTKISSDLRIHFAQEDSLLYPRLIESDDPEVAAVARTFFDEMGSLGPAFEKFSATWTRIGAIGADPLRFQREANAIFLALSGRVERENEHLYPLADRIVVAHPETCVSQNSGADGGTRTRTA